MRYFRAALAALALAFAALPALAQKLEAHVIAVDSMDGLVRWLETKPAPRGMYPRVTELVVGKKVYLPIFVTGIDPSSHEPIELVGSIEIAPPRGDTVGQRNCCRFTAKDRAGLRMALLSNPATIELDANDPKGVYTVRVSVTDGQQTFTAAEQLRYGVMATKANAPPPRPAAAPVEKGSSSVADRRNCLDLPTPQEVIRCSEGK